MSEKFFADKIKVGSHYIGEGCPMYMIAEMSANHAGSLARAKEIIHAAKESGADCIKIQTYTPDTLTIDCNNKYFNVGNGTWEGENLYRLYGKGYMPWEWQPELKEEAERVGIDFLSTPFDVTSVDFLEELGLDFYKIASFEMVDLPLVEYIASKGKPVILSTGMGSLEEIREAVEVVKKAGNRQLALLRCSSAYPAEPKEMNLKTIQDMKKRFSMPIGLSDHSMGHMSAVTAVALGAQIIEKHFCISREIENPDASFSMTPEEYRAMVDEVRSVEAAIGEPVYGISKSEEPSMVFRRSIFAVKDIVKGEAITEENTRIIRPGYGLKPKYYRDILGMKAGVNLERGIPISFDVLEKGAILFATNNGNTEGLYRWLAEREEKVYRIENKLTAEMIKALEPSFVISFNYRHLIPEEVLELLPGRVINLHTSFLPYNRGSAPNFFSFLENTPKGVTIHRMDSGLDTGDILCQKELFFDEKKETFATTYDKLLEEMKTLFQENWQAIKDGSLMPVRQVGEGTYHRMRELEAVRERVSFTWNDRIADFKKRYRESGL
ncbi:MAG: pseudaminic acid synthase [Lachnospiraceae bacterium]|nr:pseudaminic acid synthase [Lachnospiraceae bacterium]